MCKFIDEGDLPWAGRWCVTNLGDGAVCCSVPIPWHKSLLDSALSRKYWPLIYWRILYLYVLLDWESWKDDDTNLEVAKEVIFPEKAALTKLLFCFFANFTTSPQNGYLLKQEYCFYEYLFSAMEKAKFAYVKEFQKGSITSLRALNAFMLFQQEECLNCETELWNFRWTYSFSSYISETHLSSSPLKNLDFFFFSLELLRWIALLSVCPFLPAYIYGKIDEYLTFTMLKQKANKIHENLRAASYPGGLLFEIWLLVCIVLLALGFSNEIEWYLAWALLDDWQWGDVNHHLSGYYHAYPW